MSQESWIKLGSAPLMLGLLLASGCEQILLIPKTPSASIEAEVLKVVCEGSFKPIHWRTTTEEPTKSEIIEHNAVWLELCKAGAN